MEYKVGDVFTKKEWDGMTDSKGKKFVKYTLKDGDKVFIDHASSMPRTKFKKNYPNNKIVYKPEEADVFIGTDDIWHGRGYWMFYQRTPTWTQVNQITLEKNTTLKVNNQAKRKAIFNSEKPLIKDTDILYNGELPREISEAEYKRVVQMITSTDPEMVNLGMDILLRFDHTINEEKYVLALAQIRAPYCIKKSRTYKSIVRILKTKYVNLR